MQRSAGLIHQRVCNGTLSIIAIEEDGSFNDQYSERIFIYEFLLIHDFRHSVWRKNQK